MDSEFAFQIVNNVGLLSWIVLILFPYKDWTTKILITIVIGGLGITYAFLLFSTTSPGDFESFGSLAGVMALFDNPTAVLAGWIHYIAFDLLVGIYILQNAKIHDINRWIILPCLLFTFMTGPFGLLLYLIIRTVYTKQFFHPFLQ